MKINLKSRKGLSPTLILTAIITLLMVSSVFGGLLSLKNQKGELSYDEALEIAESIPEVALFLDENDNVNINGKLIDGIWTFEFSIDLLNYIEDEYSWMKYAYVEIDAETGKILYYLVRNPNEPNYTEQEIIDIAQLDPEIVFWRNLYRFIYPTVWYDGFEYWYVNYLHNETDSSAIVVISDLNQSIIHVEIYCRFPGATHSLQEIYSLTEKQSNVIAWKENNPEYRMSGIFTQNRWRINYVSDYNIIEGTSDWLYSLVNDTTLDVYLIKYRMWESNHTEQEAIDIALANLEVVSYLSTYNYTIDAEWSDSGYWGIHFYHEYIKGVCLEVVIDDNYGTINSIEFYNVTFPDMTFTEAYDYAFSISEVIEWLTFGFEYVYTLFYYNNEDYEMELWYFIIGVDTYQNTTNITFEPDDIIRYDVQFDDNTQEIVYMVRWLGDGTEEILIDEFD
ncbi:MAG TPA: hypothetical protein VMZ29_16480 [Candidatus Bathyarchaeia archaeon]|nr:hypothetical protein [Candidatus Bathyarchaeia archaeon]